MTKLKTLIYLPALNKVTGSPQATLLLCQLGYWQNKYKGKRFYKNIYSSNKRAKENNQLSIMDELGFNRYQTEKAINKLKELGLLSVTVARSSHNTFLKIDVEKLKSLTKGLIEEQKRLCLPNVEGRQSANVEGKQSTGVEGEHSSITKNTQRIHKEDLSLSLSLKTVNKQMSKLSEKDRKWVIEKSQSYVKKFKLLDKSKPFLAGVLHAHLEKLKNLKEAKKQGRSKTK